MSVEVTGIRQGNNGEIAIYVPHPGGSIVNVSSTAASEILDGLKANACANCSEANVRCPLPGRLSISGEVLKLGTADPITNPNCLIPGTTVTVSGSITIRN